jgi:hypothetical protein
MKVYANSRRSAITASKRDDLEYQCQNLNYMTGHEEDSVGSYMIDSAYGKVRLVRLYNDGGAVNAISGYVSTPQLLEIISSIKEVLRYEGFN